MRRRVKSVSRASGAARLDTVNRHSGSASGGTGRTPSAPGSPHAASGSSATRYRHTAPASVTEPGGTVTSATTPPPDTCRSTPPTRASVQPETPSSRPVGPTNPSDGPPPAGSRKCPGRPARRSAYHDVPSREGAADPSAARASRRQSVAE